MENSGDREQNKDKCDHKGQNMDNLEDRWQKKDNSNDKEKEGLIPDGEFTSMLLPRPKMIIGPLYGGAISMLVGPEGAGKSPFAQSMCKTMGTAGSHGHWDAPEVTKSLYLAGEMGDPLIQMRSKTETITNNLYWFSNDHLRKAQKQSQVDLLDPFWQGWFSAQMVSRDIRFWVLDSLSRLAPEAESTPKKWTQLYNFLFGLSSEHGISTLIIHHTGKDVRKQARGSSRMLGDCDFNLQIFPQEKCGSEKVHFILSFPKHRQIDLDADFTPTRWMLHYDPDENKSYWTAESIAQPEQPVSETYGTSVPGGSSVIDMQERGAKRRRVDQALLSHQYDDLKDAEIAEMCQCNRSLVPQRRRYLREKKRL